jgi:hypothetical protein
MNRIFTVAIMALIACGTAKATGPPNRLVNGDFESPRATDGVQTFTAPSSGITGWSVTGGNVDLVASSILFGNANTGLQLLDINGLNAGTIEQTFATTPGASYLLELYYSNNPYPVSALPSYSASVSVIGSGTLFSETLVHGGATVENMNWLRFARGFSANSPTTTVRLQSSSSGFNGMFFDTVSVVPEPSIITFALALGVMALATKRRSFPATNQVLRGFRRSQT